MNFYRINLSHKLLFTEINEQFNPNEPINVDKFIEFIVNIPKNHEIYVLQNNTEIIGCGTLIIEQKLIHNFGKVGHIEDVFIRKEHRGNNYSEIIMNYLKHIAKKRGCYKVILDCSDNLKPIYEKCGFTSKNIQMSVYFNTIDHNSSASISKELIEPTNGVAKSLNDNNISLHHMIKNSK